MFKSLFKRNKPETDKYAGTPNVMGLKLGGSFELDALALRLVMADMVVSKVAATQIIQSAGIVDLDGTTLYRFYTDDEGFLQVVANGSGEEDVVDVKMFHYYDTLDIANQAEWDQLLNNKIGASSYQLEGHTYHRVWTSTTEYHNPVHMEEKTYQDNTDFSTTDQFTMLFERELDNGEMESLFLSAEEVVNNNALERCLVISTGMTVSPTQITIHG
ncbi:YjfK family protein [Agarivorans aestuarii]|uniref:YjfK family protein n=1 Tax=Agarivorans aestuarii TaxID=1563703 RepID=A0ABU7G4J5_9ALTE|nr:MULTISPECIES: YjfK family protein [Agarivorans]MEE1674210.1 YjfK family protein [Agarivorans aestuarii]